MSPLLGLELSLSTVASEETLEDISLLELGLSLILMAVKTLESETLLEVWLSLLTAALVKTQKNVVLSDVCLTVGPTVVDTLFSVFVNLIINVVLMLNRILIVAFVPVVEFDVHVNCNGRDSDDVS